MNMFNTFGFRQELVKAGNFMHKFEIWFAYFVVDLYDQVVFYLGKNTI